MKKQFKRYISLACVLLLIFSSFVIGFATEKQTTVTASNENLSYIFPLETKQIAQKHFSNMAEMLLDEDESTDDLHLGEPFYILRTNSIFDEEIVYYPVLNDENRFVFLTTLIDTDDGWSVSLNRELVDKLNLIDYYNKDYVFYSYNDNIIAIGENESYVIMENLNDASYKNFSYSEIHDRYINGFYPFRQNRANRLDFNSFRAQSPLKAQPGVVERYITLHNPKGQGQYNLCWAASCATIINTLKNTNYTATYIADRMGVAYNTGAA